MVCINYWSYPELPKRIKNFIQRHVQHHIEDYDMKPKQAVAVAYREAEKKYDVNIKRK